MFRRILIAVDVNPCHEQIIHDGLALARLHNASVTFLTVIEDRSVEVYGRKYGTNLNKAYLQASIELLDEAVKRAEAAGVPVETSLIDTKHPSDAILEAEEAHDLCILGTHGRRGFQRFVLGSVTEEVLRRSSKPHLIVSCAQESKD